MKDVSQDRTAVPPSPGPAVEVVNVSRWYGNVVAVNDVSFSLGRGITGLLGPNGAGKSTILHIAAGLLRPSRGMVRIGGRPVWGNQAMYRDVGLVPDKETVYPFLTGYQFVLLSAKLHGLGDPAEAARRAVQAVDMEAVQDRRVGGYSKGMKQRIKVAAAIVHEPRVLLLDEPFNGTDPTQRLQMMDLLRKMAAEALASQILGSIGSWGKTGSGAGSFLGGIAASVFGGKSFAGGGFTGGGSRTGGIDGRGGFPAILHPNETVIDHDKGQGRSVTVINNFSVSTPTDRRTQEQIASMAGASIQTAMMRGA